MRHIIRQQYLHLSLHGTEAEGLALQVRLSELCQHVLLPALEQVLDRCAPAGGHLVLEHLEIDIGHLALERLDQDLAPAVAQALEKALQEPAPFKGEPAPTNSPGVKAQRRTEQEAVTAAFAYFLQTGRLPWFFRLPPGRNLEQALLEAWQQRLPAMPFAPRGDWQRVLASPASRQRLISQFSANLLLTFLQGLSPTGYQTMKRILDKLQHPGSPAGFLPALPVGLFEKRLWETLLEHLAASRPLSETNLVRQAWQDLALPGGGHSSWQAYLNQAWPGATAARPLPSAAQESKRLPLPSASQPDADREEKEGIYIDNAGLLLLHPFLPRFLEHLGLATADKLLKPDRALYLLHFLATGEPQAPEYELVLPKLLCGLDLGTPVEREAPLTKIEQAEAEALLSAVIQHWEALKSTSPDGLRGTFLVRPGRLSLRADGDWLLQVASKPYDILLNQLPWSISMIRLPWMNSLLRVEWNYS